MNHYVGIVWRAAIVLGILTLVSPSTGSAQSSHLSTVDCKAGRTITYHVSNGDVVLGDIVVGRVEILAKGCINLPEPLELNARPVIEPMMGPKTVSPPLEGSSLIWPNATVHFAIDGSVGSLWKASINQAIEHIRIYAGILFLPATSSSTEFVVFREAQLEECGNSELGRQLGRSQNINLSSACAGVGKEAMAVVVHEMIHALGFGHEHQRSDRDQFVAVAPSCTADSSYVIYTYKHTSFGAYDYASIMHYGAGSCLSSIASHISIPNPRCGDDPVVRAIGQRCAVSDSDVDGLTYYYRPKIPSAGQLSPRARAGIFSGVNELLFRKQRVGVVVEYSNTLNFPGSAGGQFFYTASANDQRFVDSGGAGGFFRTGRVFFAGGSEPVCRFYGSAKPGPNSHFFTVLSEECAMLKGLQRIPTPADVKQWNFEGVDFLSTSPLPTGVCPGGTIPVYRAYNNGFARGFDSNHRFSTNREDIQALVANHGWIDEGVRLCAAP